MISDNPAIKNNLTTKQKTHHILISHLEALQVGHAPGYLGGEVEEDGPGPDIAMVSPHGPEVLPQ